MNKIRRILMLSAISLVVAACGNNKKANETASVEDETQTVQKVSVDSAFVTEVSHSESYTSTVLPYAINNIAPMAGARLEKINVAIGDYVKAGQVLIEAGTLKLEQAELKFKNDGTELERLTGLYKEGGVSQSDYEAAVLAYNLSSKNLDDLRKNTIVTSPISGVVTAKNFDVGDMYSGGQPVLVVQQITPIKLLVGVSESDYTRVKRGDNVKITLDALPGKEFTGKINKVYPSIDISTHTVPVEIIVTNADHQLKPGMYAKVEITFDVTKSVVVPDDAVVKQVGSAQKVVYKLNSDNTVSIVVVELGTHFGHNYEILSGVQAGDILVTKGKNSLKAGDQVEVVNK